MAKNNKQNGTIEIWGHRFKKAGEGLEKAGVVAFVEDLMKKNEALIKRADHLSSLTKLAEKTIVEADKVAKQVQNEAEEQAKSEATEILGQAEEQARKLIEEKRAEALAKANQEVEATKAKARQQAEAVLQERIKELQPEVKNNIKRLYGELLTQLDNLKHQVTVLEKELDQKLSQPPPETAQKTEAPAQKAEEPVQKAEEPVQKAEEPIQNDKDILELLHPPEKIGGNEPYWALKVLRPIDLTQIMSIINYLDGLDEVEQTELIPQIEQPTITVFLSQPIDMIDILKELPQVARVTEEKSASNGGAVKTRRAQIELAGKTAPKSNN